MDTWSPRRVRRDAPEARLQATVRRPVSLSGVGLHSGTLAQMTIRPAHPNHGIVFARVDLGGLRIPARHDLVVDTRLCTVLALPGRPEARVGTVEHVLAALAASGIDNALIEIDGPELPIADGSALPFLQAVGQAGRMTFPVPVRAIEVLRPVRVAEGDSAAELLPHDRFSITMTIDFAARAIGRQSLALDELDESCFFHELADSRTFAMLGEIDALRSAGLARGGSLENAVVVDGDTVLNPGGLRRSDEFVRHKMLDAVGDLALAGAPLLAHVAAHRPGHGINNRLLHALFASPGNWRFATPGARDVA